MDTCYNIVKVEDIITKQKRPFTKDKYFMTLLV